MAFSRFRIPTTFNIEYTGPHQNLSGDSLQDNDNKEKLLYNDSNGILQWIGTNASNLPLMLDGSGKVDQQFLPSYVDDVLEYANFSAFPVTGESGKIYLDLSGANKAYRWSGSAYFLITDLSNYYNKSQVDSTTTTLQNNITSEASTRASADTTLTTNLSNEVTARTNAVSTLTTNLANEVTARTNADTTLTNNLASEVTNRTNADSTLTTNLANEVTARQNADTTLTNNLSAEVTNRTNADTGLQNSINTINTNAFMKNATGTTTINSALDVNNNNVSAVNTLTATNIRCTNLYDINGTENVVAVSQYGFDIPYNIQLRLGKNHANREANAGVILYGHPTDAPDSLTITGKSSSTSFSNGDRKIFLQDAVKIRWSLETPTLIVTTINSENYKDCLVKFDSYSDTTPSAGLGSYEYTSPAGYTMYSCEWYCNGAPVVPVERTDTYTRISYNAGAGGQPIRLKVILKKD